MKFTLAFDIFNKADTIENVVRSWLVTLSGKHEIECVFVFDALRDSSDLEVVLCMDDFTHIPYGLVYTDDVFEIKANNEALKHATGDVVLFIQDDNWMYTPSWDDTLAQVFTLPSNPTHLPGAVGLLAGVQMNKDFSLNRIECHRPHKDERAWVHGLGKDQYPLAIYEVDAINRPFAVRVDVLREQGGLDEIYCPMDYDDADLSFKLLERGLTNLYVPFDLLNICGKKETLSQSAIAENFQRGERIARERWGQFIADRETSFGLLSPMKEVDGRLSL